MLLTLLAPSLLDIFAPAPCPNIKPKACNIAINPKTIPTAPVALVPTVETKYVSAMLYILVTNIEIVVGNARVSIREGIGCLIILSYCDSYCVI